MIDIVPYYTAGLSMLVAVLSIKKLKFWRWTIIFIGLGSGQIYIYTAALALFLIVENGFKFQSRNILKPSFFCILITILISAVTARKGFDIREISEILQLIVYLFIYICTINLIKYKEDIEDVLKSGAYGAFVVSTLAILSDAYGVSQEPYIFFGRGANEGGAFVAIIGVVFATSLFNKSKNPIYVLMGLVDIYANYLATSRGGMTIAIVAVIVGIFFSTKIKPIRIVLVMAGIYTIFTRIPQIQYAIEDQQNFSTRERTLLVQYGWDVAKERFWTGWGWGSTSEIASQAPTVGIYPHFHNAYIQLIVELGLLGWFIIAGFLYFIISRSIFTATYSRDNWMPTFVVGASLSLTISAIFDAMLFGADRALQVVVVMALIGQTASVVRQGAVVAKRPGKRLTRYA